MKVTFFQGNVQTDSSVSRDLAAKTRPPILLVEDTPLLQFLHQEFLKPITCDVVATGAEALFMASRYRYDLILMDLGLPDISGLEVIQQLRQDIKNQKTPIVILTAQTLDFLPEQVTQMLYKPVNHQTLKSLVLQFIK